MTEDEAEGLGGELDFLEHFSALPDPRQAKKVLYPLDGVLLLTLCAVRSGADGWVSVAMFGQRKLAFLRRYLPFANGTPSHDQLGLVFGALDAAAFQTCFIAWTRALNGAIEGVVAVDGKTLRRSFDRAGNKGAVHMVSAWSSVQKLTLGVRVVDGKSNEIAAIPELLDLLASRARSSPLTPWAASGKSPPRSSTRAPITSSASRATKAACATMSSCCSRSNQPAVSRISPSPRHRPSTPQR